MNTINKQTLNISKFLCLVVFLFATINVTDADLFSEWDTDGSGEISESEFQENFSAEHYSAWDANNDENLTEEEYYQATFMILDENQDQQLSSAESDWGYEHLYGDYVDYDVDVQEGQDSTTVNLNYDQYRESVRDTRFYSDTDTNADSNLTREELASSIFASLDWDNNGSLSSTEFEQFNRYNVNSMNESEE